MSNTNAVDDGDERCAALARVVHTLEALQAAQGDASRRVHIPGDEIFLDPFDLRGASSR